MNMQWYEVTATAGPHVAGLRKPANNRIRLTERQAAHELRLGNIAGLPVAEPEAPVAEPEAPATGPLRKGR